MKTFLPTRWDENSEKFQKPIHLDTPPGRNKTLDCYITAVEKAVLEGAPSTCRNLKLRSNITRKECEVLTTLKQDANIVIFQADKGSAVVVQNRSDYLAEARIKTVLTYTKMFNSIQLPNLQTGLGKQSIRHFIQELLMKRLQTIQS